MTRAILSVLFVVFAVLFVLHIGNPLLVLIGLMAVSQTAIGALRK
jgi:hypothetical protein